MRVGASQLPDSVCRGEKMNQDEGRITQAGNYVFISYSHRDSERILPFITRLINDGFHVWYDEGIDPGSEWDENIAAHLQGCSGIIAFLSENYLGSENCRDELNYARDLGKDRLLIYLENVELPAGMAMRLNRLQAIHKFRYKNDDIFYSELAKAPILKPCRPSAAVTHKGNAAPHTGSPEEITAAVTGPVSKKELIKLPEYRTLSNIVLFSAFAVYILAPAFVCFGDYFGAPILLILAILGHLRLDYRFVIPAVVLSFIFGCVYIPYHFILFIFLILFLASLREVNRAYDQYLSTGEITQFKPFSRKKPV